MAYQTIVIDYAPKAKSMAAEVEKKANEMEQEDWELCRSPLPTPPRGFWSFTGRITILEINAFHAKKPVPTDRLFLRHFFGKQA